MKWSLDWINTVLRSASSLLSFVRVGEGLEEGEYSWFDWAMCANGDRLEVMIVSITLPLPPF